MLSFDGLNNFEEITMHYKSILAIAVSLTCISATAARWYDRAGAVHWTADSTLDNGPIPDNPRVVRGLPVDLCTAGNNKCGSQGNQTAPVVAAAAPSAQRSWTSYFPGGTRYIHINAEYGITFSIDSSGRPFFNPRGSRFLFPSGNYCEANRTCQLPTPDVNTEIVLRDCDFGPWKFTAKPELSGDPNNNIHLDWSFKQEFQACPVVYDWSGGN